MLAKVFEGRGARLTIGSDAGTAGAIEAMGNLHEQTSHGEIVIDEKLKLVTSPCYMLDANIGHIADGAENTVRALLEMA